MPILRVKLDRPLSPVLLALIKALDLAARQLSIPYFVIGATARDILMEHVYELEADRATRDVDFAVALSSWDAFDQLRQQLIATGAFVAGPTAHLKSYSGDPERIALLLEVFLRECRE